MKTNHPGYAMQFISPNPTSEKETRRVRLLGCAIAHFLEAMDFEVNTDFFTEEREDEETC